MREEISTETAVRQGNKPVHPLDHGELTRRGEQSARRCCASQELRRYIRETRVKVVCSTRLVQPASGSRRDCHEIAVPHLESRSNTPRSERAAC